MLETIKKSIEHNRTVIGDVLDDEILLNNIVNVATLINKKLDRGYSIFTCGNGGSMADALHFTAELVGRFQSNRQSLPSITLGTNASNYTAIANDFGYSKIFSRELSSLARKGDVLLVFSTSGKSENITEAIKLASKKGMDVIGFLGQDILDYESLFTYSLHVPSGYTSRIQELHTLIIHLLCELLEQNLTVSHFN